MRHRRGLPSPQQERLYSGVVTQTKKLTLRRRMTNAPVFFPEQNDLNDPHKDCVILSV